MSALVPLCAPQRDSILLTQRMLTSPVPAELARDFSAAAYAGIDA